MKSSGGVIMVRAAPVPWTQEDEDRMIAWREEEGKSFAFIGARLGRGEKSCCSRYNNICRRNPTTGKVFVKRFCLKCRVEFTPQYSGQYFCSERCRPKDDGAGIFSTAVVWSHATRARSGA